MALRSRIYHVDEADGLAILWRQRFRAFAGEQPRSLRGHAALCQELHTAQWPACQGVPGATPRRGRAGQELSDGFNELQLVMMPCAFTDGGRNHKGALWDATRVLNAQHRRATPAFARAPLRRYPVAAVGLTPYGHLHDSHFYASTAPWILQLLELLPPPIPIVVSLSPRLVALYSRLAVPMERLHVLPAGGAVSAERLLSLVTLPLGALEPLGASALGRVRSRFVPLPPPRAQHVYVVLLSRADMGRKRSLSNEAELLRALRSGLVATKTGMSPHAGPPGLDVRRYVGSDKLSLAATAQLFSRAALLTGPHGGAFLNMIYCPAGTPVVEIGYARAR